MLWGSQGEETKGWKCIYEAVTQNFLSPNEEGNRCPGTGNRVPNKMNPERPTPRNITIKMAKIKGKERVLKAAEESKEGMQGYPHKALSCYFCKSLHTRGSGMIYLKS